MLTLSLYCSAFYDMIHPLSIRKTFIETNLFAFSPHYNRSKDYHRRYYPLFQKKFKGNPVFLDIEEEHMGIHAFNIKQFRAYIDLLPKSITKKNMELWEQHGKALIHAYEKYSESIEDSIKLKSFKDGIFEHAKAEAECQALLPK